MSFSAPWWLLVLLLVPLLVVLHALSIRWRATPVSSLVFWREVLKERKASLRVRRLLTSLVLLLQCLAMAALAISLAGPLIAGLGRAGTQDVILVMDATASMQVREGNRTRWDIAREHALGLAAGLRGGARMAVVLAEKQPRLLSPFTADRGALRRMLETAGPTDEPGDVASSVLFALSLRDPRRGGQVVLETDGAYPDLPGVDATLPWLRVDLVGSARDNVGITRMAFRRDPRAGAGYQLFLAFRNAGRAAVSVPLTVKAGSRDVIRREVEVAPGERSTVTVPWAGPTSGRVEASIQSGDAFPLDDRAFAVFAPARPLSVLVVGPQSYFIEQALAALPGVTVKTQAAPPSGPAAEDVVVYVDVDPPPLEGGSFLLFDAVPPNLPLRARGVLNVPPVTGWDRTDPLLGSVSLSGITIGKALDLDPGPGFSVLAASGTSPLLLAWDHAGVKALVAAFNPAATDLPLRPGFPVLLANALSWFHPEWLQVQADQQQAGDPRLIPTGGAQTVTVVKPDGERETLPADGGSARLVDTDQVGFYRVETPGTAAPATPGTATSGTAAPGTTREFAVNLASDAETDITPRFTPPASAGEGAGSRVAVPSPAWRVFAVAALALLVLELLAWSLRRRGGREPLGSARARTFFALRAAAFLCLVLGLAGLAAARFSDRLSVVFVLDQSRSVSAADRNGALALVEKIRGRLAGGDRASLVRFGASAESETLEAGLPVAPEGGDVDAAATDIGSAIQDALAQAGRGGSPRIVLLTDGNENRGDADSAAETARSLGARIFPVPLGNVPSGTEVAVDDVRAPSRVRQDEAHEVTVMIRSRTPVTARVTLLRDTLPVATRVQDLSPGENAVQFTGTFPERGLHAWDALVEAPGDQVPQNNHERRLVEVSGAPRVLYVSRPGRGSPSLLSALSAQGISVESRPASALPGTLAGYLPFDALIMDNVPGYGISTEKMETIAQYVRDAGGGLLMAGGDSSFGAGGYYKTPIERVLPVDMDARSQVQVPGLSLVIVLDKSGSMGASVPTGETKLDVVKSAALAAIESLNPFDRAGVIAFDADWEWSVPMTGAGDIPRITDGLSTLTAGGGTILYPALEEADRALSASSSPLRHVILLTDGLTDAADFKGLLGRMSQHHITVSTVAVGDDADAALLADIARWGGGRTYATSDARDVPRIFLTDTTIASRGLLVEKSFFPRELSAADYVRGLPLAGMPALRGFVLTYAKPGAETVLSALYDAPLLASWRYGLGRTAAFTSDFGGRWSADWLSWGPFPRLAAQLVRWIERPTGPEVLHPRIDVHGGRAALTVDAWDSLGAYLNGLSISGILIRPSGAREELPVLQSGPGLYEASFAAAEPGDYVLTLAARTGEGGSGDELPPVTIGTSIAYSEEYRVTGVNTALLSRLASVTGGRLVSPGDDGTGLAAILKREPGPAGAGDETWRWFLLAAALVFLADVAARRLAAPREILGRLLTRLRSLRGLRRLGGQAFSSEQLAGLVARAREEERSRMKHRLSGIAREGKLDPDLAAYLYIARLRSSRAAKEEGRKP